MDHEYIVELKSPDDWDSTDGFNNYDAAKAYAKDKLLTEKWTEANVFYKERQLRLTRSVKSSFK